MINQVKHLQGLYDANLPVNEFVIINSIWLSLMGLRQNGDLDLLLSSKIWNQRFSDKPKNISFGIPGPYERRLRVHSIETGPYGKLVGVRDNDDVVYNHRILVEGLPLVKPSLYFRYKVNRFLLMDNEMNKIPIWRKNFLFEGKNKKLISKWKKDNNDFELIKSYFSTQRNKLENLAHITDEQWGLEDEFLLPFISKRF